MSAISVVGMAMDMPGLKGSLAKFRKHNEEVADAIRNVSGIGTRDNLPVHQDETRIAFPPLMWPRMVYHADGRDQSCAHDKQYQEFLNKGFRDKPYPRVQVALADPATEKVALQTQLKEKDGQIASLTEQSIKLAEMLEAQGAMMREIMERQNMLEASQYGDEGPAAAAPVKKGK